MAESNTPSHGWLQRLGLGNRELRSWALYDWANSAFATTIMVAILPIFYAEVAAKDLPDHVRTAYWGNSYYELHWLSASLSLDLPIQMEPASQTGNTGDLHK